MKKIVLLLNVLVSISVLAKDPNATQGKITYERKMNTIAELQEQFGDYGYINKYMASIPPYNTSYFDLYFDTSHSIYKPGRKDTSTYQILGDKPAFSTSVLTDFGNKKVKALKLIYGQKYLVKDNMRQIKWKLKHDVVTVAGYKCHKAIGKICDSVDVIAYYTEKIPVHGGPEMFGGLPGMILKLEIPRMHTEWVGTVVDLAKQQNVDYSIPENGKSVNEKELYGAISNDFKKWGKQTDKNIWWTVL